MKLLAIETATEACSAALWINGELRERYEVAPRRHGELVLPMIDDLLQEADLALSNLDALAFGRGPGSFTGVRMATGVVQGLAFAADLPVVPVSTLAALAQSVVEQAGSTPIFSALDARMSEVYWGVYALNENRELELRGQEHVLPPASVQAEGAASGIAVGHGWRTYQTPLAKAVHVPIEACFPDQLPQAGAVAKLAVQYYQQGRELLPAEQALPVYLRDNVAKKKAQG